MYKSQVSTKTAHGDTTKTLIDTITVPDGVSQIVGVCAHAEGGAGITTLENISGILELESDDAPITPAQFLLDNTMVLTSGTAVHSPRVWPCNIPVKAGNRIKGYVTLDLAQTVAGTARFMLIYA